MSSRALPLKALRGPSHSTLERRVALANTTLLISVWTCLGAVLFREITGSATIAYFGSYHFTTSEPIFMAALLAAIVTLPIYKIGWGPLTWVTGVFVTIALINFTLGLLLDVNAAVVGLRGSAVFCFFLVLGRVLYDRDRLVKVFMSVAAPLAWALCLLVLLRLIFGPELFIQTKDFDAIGINDGGRPLAAPGVLFLGVFLTILTSQFISGQSRLFSSLGLLAGAVVFAVVMSGQGTASIATIVGVSIVMCFQPGPNHSYRVLAYLLAGLLAAIGFSALSLMGGDVLGLLPSETAEGLARRAGNLQTREQAWAGIMYAYSTSTSWQQVMGWPAGTWPYIVIEHHQWGRVVWTVNAHSVYFGTLIRLGWVGLSCLMILMTTTLAAMIYRVVQRPLANARAMPVIALLIMMFLYGYSYEFAEEQGLYLALALATASGLITRDGTLGGKQPRRRTGFKPSGAAGVVASPPATLNPTL